MIFRFTLLAFAIAFLTNAGLSHAQPAVVSPQFSGGAVTPIPAVVANPQAIDPYATVATQSPYQSYAPWLDTIPVIGTGPIFGNFNNSGDRFWVRLEYLNWWTDGTNVPALVTTSPDGTPRETAAVLGESGTSVLFGNQDLNGGSTPGFYTSAGFWATPQHSWGIEVEYYELAKQNENFAQVETGPPYLVDLSSTLSRDEKRHS